MALYPASVAPVIRYSDQIGRLQDPRPRGRGLLLLLLAVAVLVGAFVVVGLLVDPSLGAAGGCGGG